jgi:putative ABC transport system permease protein
MLKNYLITAIRNGWKNKLYSLINVLGLAVGISCVVIILLFIQDEYSFDSFQLKANRLYRLNKIFTSQTGSSEHHAITSGMMGPTLADEFNEVEQSVRLLPWFSDVLMIEDDISLKVSDVVIADANFFQVFDFTLLQGDPESVLAEPMSIVLSESTARRFFGKSNPLGRTILGFRNQIYTVTGIVENTPQNSHLKYKALISWSSTVPGVGPLNISWLNNWRTQANFTYLLLRKNADPVRLEQKLQDFMRRHMAERIEQYQLYLQPFPEIYLHSSDIRYTSNTKIGNQTYIFIFSAIAVFILFIACINFINLTTAQATRRAREVGIRKILGSYRKQLITQFLGESFLFSSLSMIIALMFVDLSLPFLNRKLELHLTLDFPNLPIIALIFVVTTAFVGIAAGSYPAFILSAFHPLQTIKMFGPGERKTILTRKVLAILQFVMTIILIVGTVVIFRQLEFVSNKNLGFQKENLIILPIGNTSISEQFPAFKTELLKHPDILNAAGSNSFPGEASMSFQIKPEGIPDEEQWIVHSIMVDDYDFLSTYKMEMADGRYFSADHSTDTSHGVVINETLARNLGWKNAVGKRLDIEGELENGQVIGVIKDFHMRSMHHTIEPLLIIFAPRFENLVLRIREKDIPGTIKFIQKKWQAFESRYPFEYHFLDQRLDQLYRSERRLLEIFGIFSALAITIACLGLLGLAAFTAQQRTKEIGIRKVHGASIANVTVLLSKDFIKLVILANVIAWPVAWYAASKWLQNFVYHIPISWWVFILAGGIAIFIALLTVSTQAIHAARANPIDSIRYE